MMNIERGDRAELIQKILELKRELRHFQRVITGLEIANNRYKKERKERVI